jgi:hypothetical protein
MESVMLTSSTTTRIQLAILACFAAADCAAPVSSEEPIASQTEALSQKCGPPAVPDSLAVPAGNVLEFHLDGVGVQIYTCQLSASGSYAWVFKAPQADLFGPGGRLAGAHYAGPTWEALDGSTVVGSKLAAYTADPSAIPWLLLQAASHDGKGLMSKVTYVQRLSTVGGLAPTTGCDADHVGAEADVDYTATYYFYRASHAQH